MANLGRADAAGLLVLGRVLSSAAEAISPLVMVRVLAKDQLGVLGAFLLLHGTIAMAASAGSDRAILYFLTNRSAADRRATAGAIARLQASAGLLGATGLAAFAALVAIGLPAALGEGLTPQRLALLALYVCLDVPTRLLPNLLIAEQRARAAAGMQVFRSFGLVTSTMAPAVLGFGVDGVLAALVLFASVHVVITWAWHRALFAAAPANGEAPALRSLLAFALPLTANDMVGWLNATLDRYLILWAFPPARFAEYRAGAWQIPILTTIPYSIGTVDTPHYTKLCSEGRGAEAIAMWRATIAKSSLVVIPIALGFCLAAEPFVRLAFTADYAAAADVFRWYCLVTMLRVAAFGPLLVGAGRPGHILRATLFSVGSNVLLSIPCLWLFGFEGPAIGTFLAVFPTYLVWSYYVANVTGVAFRDTFPWVMVLKVVACAAIPGAICAQLATTLGWSDAVSLAVILGGTIAGFAAIGSAVGLIVRDDWRFAGRWLAMRALRRPAPR